MSNTPLSDFLDEYAASNAARFHITDEVKLALPDITFTQPPAAPLETILAGYALRTGETIEDLTDDPTTADINELLGVLRTSGVIEAPEEDPDEDPEEVTES